MKTQKHLITTINDLTNAKYIKKDIKVFVKDNLELLKEHTKDEETKQLDTVIEMVSKQKLKSEDRKKLKQMRSSLVNVVKKYEEEFNDETSEDVINENLTVDEIESMLDQKIPEYNGFNEKHPMKGVSWNKSNNKYYVRYKNINTYTKDLPTACKQIVNQHEKSKINHNEITKEVISNKYCQLIKYIYKNKTYYDVQHILNYMGHKKSSRNEKYNEIKDKLTEYLWHRNNFGGYIRRQLITLKKIKYLIHKSRTQSIINLANLLNINIIDYKVPTKEESCSNKILKVFNKEKYILQKNFGKYRVDLYFPKYKLAIECDEFDHIVRSKIYEKKRQTYIKNMDITFIRFNPDDKDFDIFETISKIHYHITNI